MSDVITKSGITTGTIVVEIEKEDGTKITAEDFNYGKPTSMELLQGSSEGMMKAQFTLSDGTTIQSNDFQVLEMVTGDLYITSFTFKNGSSQGKISADIGLSDGRTLQANDFQLPTDPQVTQNIASLLSRMTAVEKKNSQQDTELSSLDARVKAIEDTPGISKFELGKLGTIMGSSDNGRISANPDGTGSVNGWDTVATVDELTEIQSDIQETSDKLTEIQSDLQEQITNIKPTVTVNDSVSPPTITVAVNGKSSIANLPSGGNVEITQITNMTTLINEMQNLTGGEFLYGFELGKGENRLRYFSFQYIYHSGSRYIFGGSGNISIFTQSTTTYGIAYELYVEPSTDTVIIYYLEPTESGSSSMNLNPPNRFDNIFLMKFNHG